MNVYVSNIFTAALSFPLIAFLITLPYMVYQYRKFGSIPWLRTLVVYSFVFYLLCAYFLVLLPLPEDRSAIVPYAQTPQLVPFNFVHEFLAETSFSIGDPSTWLATLRDPYIYEAFFNVLLLVPLGMYLRYYFRRTWWQTLIIGFLVTLSFETTQLTGLWGLYEHPYRLFDVDDLIMNTLGAMTGFWMVGPAMRVLPDIRLVNEEAREAGMRASVTKRALSFLIDALIVFAVSLVLLFGVAGSGVADRLIAQEGVWNAAAYGLDLLVLGTFFVIVPVLTRGQTLGQKLLRLRIVRSDASRAHWYQYLARYGLLYLMIWAPFAVLNGVAELDPATTSEMGSLVGFAAQHQTALMLAWVVLMVAWGVSLAVRAVRSWRLKQPFVMLNGVLSNTRVMTQAGVELARERRAVLDVDEVAALERAIAEDGTPLIELMDRAGRAVAEEVRAWVPDPAPVVVLAGSGNNGGDGWVVARTLAEAGYPVTLVASDLAERLHAEPARTTALDAFAQAAEDGLPLSVLIAPDADVLADAIDRAEAVVDALLGTGFSGDEVREPYASWIRAANRRRFEGSRGKGRGRHRKRTHERGDHVRARRSLPAKVKDAPFAVAVDVPSGLAAQTGAVARPAFAADMTVTMLAFKPGLVASATAPWTGIVKLAKLDVDVARYREADALLDR
ncbi:VanZ family protein [Eggerthella guodeyinii]|uniref:NAD(P)H-hydrate epimerase n=1 Tax=Eggerthella guodeyinii TaxID=2690837 RepID=A0A6L7IQF6_9ACTN|nr:NAD(P)H-hydrate epimerase [Eggerthella guodeyinii]QOS69605.1 VanZ family protein [Eggerthella guodeyinii]